MTRPYRGARLEIDIVRGGEPGVIADGRRLEDRLLREVTAGATHRITVAVA
jgi:hypothetical protein